ncbi:MAG: sigma-54 dependent transcriptional regulator [Candidatus Poribacteria bacterium]|nr:sigma-54 dependent transcriptional regulator [Candidatus Poribacteria bacterium]
MSENKRILVVDDDAPIRNSLEKILKRDGYNVFTAAGGESALKLVRQQPVHLILTDLKMPRMDGLQLLKAAKILSPEIEVIVMTAFGDVDSAVKAMREGAYHFIRKPLKRAEIRLTITRALEKQNLAIEVQSFRERMESDRHLSNIIGKSPVMRQLIAKVQQVAASSASVLITGESGTGKEIFANAIHSLSPRANQPMIKVNCGALPDALLESELFGYEKGAFTDAKSTKAGRFELADTGTLFLDEIGEMPKPLQVKLLRVLQDGKFERLGGTKTLSVDVRLIAATNKNLIAEVESGNFRDDLFYRLNVITLELPPLRSRIDDIPLLVNRFLKKYSEKDKKPIQNISRQALETLEGYHWPGNVRELENAIEQAVVLTQSDGIENSDLPMSVRGSGKDSDSTFAKKSIVIPLGTTMEVAEKRLISETLKMTGGDKELTAKLLDISSRTIYRKLGNDSDDQCELPDSTSETSHDY